MILLIESGLLNDHLLEQVFLGFEDEHLPEPLLMLLNTKPLLVAALGLRDVFLLFRVHIKNTLVHNAEFGLLDIVPEVDVWLAIVLVILARVTITIAVKVLLRGLVQTFQQALVLQVFPLLVVQVGLFLL